MDGFEVIPADAAEVAAAGLVMSRELGWDDLTAIKEMVTGLIELGSEAPVEFEGIRVIGGWRDANTGYFRLVGRPVTGEFEGNSGGPTG